MLHEVHMPFRYLARVAGISNIQIFKSLRSASNFIWQVKNPNSFGMCSGCSKVYIASFFLIFGDFFFRILFFASPNACQGNSITRYVFIHFVSTFKCTSLTIKTIQRFLGELPDATYRNSSRNLPFYLVGKKSLDSFLKDSGLL